jgi:hypothetical protein
MEKLPEVGSQSPSPAPRKTLIMHRLHVWITDRDYEFLSDIAAENEQTVAHTVRQLIRSAREQHAAMRFPNRSA